MHGRLRPAERRELMAQFKARELDVLVATTVIEVGVDVPNATIMIIQEADRFGLAQLHQLRGRVGRGAEQSYCLLVSRAKEELTDSALARLEALVATTDGFELAEKDLEIRGEGQLLGTRQAGFSDLKFTRLRSDREAPRAGARGGRAARGLRGPAERRGGPRLRRQGGSGVTQRMWLTAVVLGLIVTALFWIDPIFIPLALTGPIVWGGFAGVAEASLAVAADGVAGRRARRSGLRLRGQPRGRRVPPRTDVHALCARVVRVVDRAALRDVRIIAGSRKGARIFAPKSETRPTGDRVREAAFNLIGPVDDMAVLDLFAGSGAMGLEALSRGAASAVFVESDRDAQRAIERNLEKLGLKGARIAKQDARRALAAETAAGSRYDLVLVDPPYRMFDSLQPTLAAYLPALLAEDGLVVVETGQAHRARAAAGAADQPHVRVCAAHTVRMTPAT